ncbi:MAG: hypothetical protein PUB32_00740 [Clostridiales bacterium]|nr:hypothetical protein [Clostridiales bacterium]
MSDFKKENLENIKNIFEERTGVELPERRNLRRPLKIALILAALVACLSITAFAGVQFSSLQGDELAFNEVCYEGNGVIAISVENRSDKLLEFEHDFWLVQWRGGKVDVDMDAVKFENTKFMPYSKGVMRIDLSEACDVAALEQPLEKGNWYYIRLTNDRFLFGQDWMCSVDFCKREEEAAPEPAPDDSIVEPSSGEEARAQIEESLRPYFENISIDILERRQQLYDYIAAYTKLFEEFDGEIVQSVSPYLPGNRIDTSQPLLTVRHAEIPGIDTVSSTFHRRSGIDADFRLLATEGEYAYVVDAVLDAEDGKQLSVPMIFILSYERENIRDDAYAFIHGRLLTFAELEPYKVYEGEGKVSYEISSLIYDDAEAYVRAVAAQQSSLVLPEESMDTFVTLHEQYTGNLSELIYYRTVE